jgi:enterochelin esterase family protein
VKDASLPELTLVELSHGQSEWNHLNESFYKAHQISGKDLASYMLADDVVSDYRLSADSLPQVDVPRGSYYHFRWTSRSVYPGVERDVHLYLPHGAPDADSVNLLVCQDGLDYVGPLVQATTVLDNLVHRGEIPMTVGLFVSPGESGPGYPIFGGTDNRSIE